MQFIPVGGNVSTLNITGHNFDEEIMRHIVTHTGSNGVAARIAGVLDLRGTVNADFDLDAPPFSNPPNVVPGVKGVLRFFLSAAAFVSAPVIVSKLHFESAVSSQVKYSFDVEMDSITGVYTRP